MMRNDVELMLMQTLSHPMPPDPLRLAQLASHVPEAQLRRLWARLAPKQRERLRPVLPAAMLASIPRGTGTPSKHTATAREREIADLRKTVARLTVAAKRLGIGVAVPTEDPPPPPKRAAVRGTQRPYDTGPAMVQMHREKAAQAARIGDATMAAHHLTEAARYERLGGAPIRRLAQAAIPQMIA